MIINNKRMCVPQPNQIALLDKIAPMAPRATLEEDKISSAVSMKQSSEILEDNDENDVPTPDENDVEPETETIVTPPQEPLYPETSLPISPSRTSKSKKQTKKYVRFNQAVIARPCLHRKDYTSREAAASWYGQREFEDIRRELLKTLSLIYAGKFVECDESSSELFGRDESSSSLATVCTSGSLRPLHEQESQHSRQSHFVSTSRGLEGFTVKGSLLSRIRKLRQKAITEVLVEQDFQVDRAESMKIDYLFYDDESIRKVYRKHSKIASDIAQERGIEDHLVAIGAAPAIVAPVTVKRRGLKILFSSKAQTPQKARRRWSEANMADAAKTVMARKPQRRSWISEKKLGKKQLWSLFTPKSSKPNNTTATMA